MPERYIKAGILLAAMLVAGVLFSAPWGTERQPAVVDAVAELDGQWVGRRAPGFELQGMDGQVHRLSDYRGKVVFLNFWASFCKPCRREMPSMERLAREYDDRGLEMIAVSLDPEQQAISDFMAQFLPRQQTAMTVLWDPANSVSHAYGTELIPETYLIDRQGRVVARFVSEYDWTRPKVKQLVEALLS